MPQYRLGFFERVTPHAILPEPDQPDSGRAAVVNVARNNYSVESGARGDAAMGNSGVKTALRAGCLITRLRCHPDGMHPCA